jgi:hypothetical protein
MVVSHTIVVGNAGSNRHSDEPRRTVPARFCDVEPCRRGNVLRREAAGDEVGEGLASSARSWSSKSFRRLHFWLVFDVVKNLTSNAFRSEHTPECGRRFHGADARREHLARIQALWNELKTTVRNHRVGLIRTTVAESGAYSFRGSGRYSRRFAIHSAPSPPPAPFAVSSNLSKHVFAAAAGSQGIWL